MASFNSHTSILRVLISLLALISSTVYARSLVGDQKSSHSIDIVKHPNWTPQQVPTTEVYASVFLKHNKPMPAPLRKAWSKLQTRNSASPSDRRRGNLIEGTTTASTAGFYTALVRWGTPQQETWLMLDTGSSDLWCYTWLMEVWHTADLTGHLYYNGTKSSTGSAMDGQEFAACYGGGCVYGDMWQDTVWVDTLGVEGNPVPGIWDQEIQVWGSLGIDGILGLGNNYWDSEYPDAQQTWVTYVLSQLTLKLFTLTLIGNGGGGSVDFGVIDSSKYTGSIAYTPVNLIPGTTSGYWAFNWSGFKIGSSTWNTTSIQFMTDSGSPVSTLPPSIVSLFWSQVPGAIQATDGSWSYPCNNTLPNIIIGIGSSKVAIRGVHLVGGTTSGGYCFGSIQNGPEHDYQVWGWQFFASLFVVHDYGNMQMGFANRTD